MANKQPFDETLYRLVEHDDAAASAAELKTRIDGEPEFAAAFDRTRKTVLSLQGMGPKPADRAVGTFTQRDFDRLTKGVLKSYHTKLSDIYWALGKAYLHQAPEHRLALLGRDRDLGPEKILPNLDKARTSYLAVGGYNDKVVVDGQTFLSQDPIWKSFDCLGAAKALTPKNPLPRVWEGWAFLKLKDFQKARSAFAAASEVASEWADKKLAINGLAVSSFFADDYLKQIELHQSVLSLDPSSPVDLNNLGMALINLGDHGRAVSTLEGLYARSEDEPMVRDVCVRAISVADRPWHSFRGKEALFRRFVRAARVHLGEEFGEKIERLAV